MAEAKKKKSNAILAEEVKPEDVPETVALAINPLISQGALSPIEVRDMAVAIANSFMEVVNEQGMYHVIPSGGKRKKFVAHEGWLTIASMMQCFPHEDYNERFLNEENEVCYSAKCSMRRLDGDLVSSASHMCGGSTDTVGKGASWNDRPEPARKSMAMTRAQNKAIAGAFRWIVKMAGFEGTPAEEMQWVEEDTEAKKELTDFQRRKKATVVLPPSPKDKKKVVKRRKKKNGSTKA